MKVYVVTNGLGILLGAYRRLMDAEIEIDKYAKECVSTDSDLMIWELESEQVDKPIKNWFRCLKIKKI